MSIEPVQFILKKRNGEELTEEEIGAFVSAFTAGEIADYQATAFLMTTYFNGMTPRERFALTKAIAESGDLIDLCGIPGPKADKHSTGGVGDKVSLVLAPLAAAVGCRVPMLSGRGLQHTGGTLDKLESLAGLRTDFQPEEFVRLVSTVGAAIVSQSAQLAPADGKLYALRDVTGTVDSLPLIVSSIMSKKFASGVRSLVLDVKTGNGAFMQQREDARALAEAMVEVGHDLGMKVSALITEMSQPLGRMVGNALEVIETAQTLRGRGPSDLTELTLVFAQEMGRLEGMGDIRPALETALGDGSAYAKFIEMIEAQGAERGALERLDAEQADVSRTVLPAPTSGWVTAIEARTIGWAVCLLGGGRRNMDDRIDHKVGCELHVKVGEQIAEGDPVLTVHGLKEPEDGGLEPFARAVKIAPEPPVEVPPLVYETVR